MSPVPNSANDRRNPLVDLPISEIDFQAIDAVLLTHTHHDHFDDTAAERLTKNLLVSGYVLQAPKAPSLYVAGDTVLAPDVEKVLGVYQPQVTVVFAGAAQFVRGDPITMTAEDIGQVCRIS